MENVEEEPLTVEVEESEDVWESGLLRRKKKRLTRGLCNAK